MDFDWQGKIYVFQRRRRCGKFDWHRENGVPRDWKKMPILETAWDSGISVFWRSMELPLFGSCPAAFPPDLPCRSLQDAWDIDFEEILCQAVADGVGVPLWWYLPSKTLSWFGSSSEPFSSLRFHLNLTQHIEQMKNSTRRKLRSLFESNNLWTLEIY